MTKIVHITLGKANPDRMNGVNAVVNQLATYMSATQQDVEVWGLSQKRGKEPVVKAYPFHLFKKGAHSFTLNDDLKRAVAQLPEDTVVHFHGVFAPIYVALAKTLHKRRIPYVVTPHAAFSRVPLTKKIYHHFFEQRFLSRAKVIHALSPKEAETIRPFAGYTRITIMPNGIELKDAEKNTMRASLVFGYIGRFDKEQKGLDLLIDAFGLYRDKGGEGYLWLIGDGEDKKWLQDRAKKHERYIRFYPPVFGKEKQEMHRDIDVFIHTSRWEGMPMAVLEAASHACPLIVTKGTGLSEGVAQWKAGWVIEDGNIALIANAMCEAEEAGRITLDDMGMQARRMIENDYAWDKIVPYMQRELYG